MSKSPESLNLIQRAAKRFSEQSEKLEPLIKRGGDIDPILAAKPVSSGDVRLEQSARPQPPQPSPQGASARHEIRLNYAKFRLEQILTPENTGLATHDEYRLIKRKLLLLARDSKTDRLSRNVVMITSALPGEGKTFTSLNLVISLAAERNLHVLLIDADVVKPSVDGFFTGGDGKGLTNLLNGTVEHVNDVVNHCADIPNLSVMFAGPHDSRSPEFMASRRMAEIFAELAAQYPDCLIIVDSPPALASSEPTALAMHVHQIIMVVGAELSSRHHVEEALERVGTCRNISLIFNKSPHWRKAASSYYYYQPAQDTNAPAA
jgi:receptor protein-tyrosine kinase